MQTISVVLLKPKDGDAIIVSPGFEEASGLYREGATLPLPS